MSKVLVGIVLYNPEIERLLLEINSIYHQVDAVCLFDNGSSNWQEVQTRIEFLNLDNIIFLEDFNNTGIGHATNKIFEEAHKRKFDWVLTLDQDTLCPDMLVENYKEYLKENTPGMMCPSVIDRGLAKNSWVGNTETKFEQVDRCIQSGALVSVNAWKAVDGFDEWMFIDFVDFDFCMRLKVHNFDIVRCNKVCIDHQLGTKEKTIFAPLFDRLTKVSGIEQFKYFTYINLFSSARIYYTTRNNIVFLNRYRNNIDKRKEYADFIKRIIKRILRSKHKCMIIKETIRGAKDGLKYINDGGI